MPYKNSHSYIESCQPCKFQPDFLLCLDVSHLSSITGSNLSSQLPDQAVPETGGLVVVAVAALSARYDRDVILEVLCSGQGIQQVDAVTLQILPSCDRGLPVHVLYLHHEGRFLQHKVGMGGGGGSDFFFWEGGISIETIEANLINKVSEL